MQAGTPARDFLQPRLERLLQDAAGAGIARDVAVAVLIDLVTGPGFNDVPLDPRADDPHPGENPDAMTVHEIAVAEGEGQPPGLAGASVRLRRMIDPSPT